MPKLKIKIDLENDVFQSHADTAQAVRDAAERIERNLNNKEVDGPLYDTNGNKIGKWSIK